jgi:hypothetical protein
VADDSGELERAELSKMRGEHAKKIKDPKERKKYIALQGEKEVESKRETGKYGASTYDLRNRTVAEPDSYKRGGKVRKTGKAKVHKGERVLTGKQNREYERKLRSKRKSKKLARKR